jgi:hypothetical protein
VAQVFVSHSSKDHELRDLLTKAFAATKVRGVFEEFDAITQGPANASRILIDIRASNAMFLAVGKNVESLRHTRDWVAFESGAASGSSMQPVKDVWVIETIGDMETLSFVVPRLQHYVCLDTRIESWQGYLTQVINSYDDSHVIKAMAAGGLVGVAAAKRPEGAIVGIGAALLFAAIASQSRPMGVPIRCPQCASVYNVHLATSRMRCPVCNTRLTLSLP